MLLQLGPALVALAIHFVLQLQSHERVAVAMLLAQVHSLTISSANATLLRALCNEPAIFGDALVAIFLGAALVRPVNFSRFFNYSSPAQHL